MHVNGDVTGGGGWGWVGGRKKCRFHGHTKLCMCDVCDTATEQRFPFAPSVYLQLILI